MGREGGVWNSGRAGDDSGFSMMEVIIAMVIFTVFCGISLALLTQTTDVTRGNLQRTAAANLAAEQIQLARSSSALSITNLTRDQTVANTLYTITQTTRFLASDSTTSVCEGASAALAYKLVTVSVKWPGMGSIEPVRADTLKAVGIGSDGLGTNGALALGIAGGTGAPISGMTVTLNNGSTAETEDDGCALFVGLPAGSYTATLNDAGYVGSANTQSVVKSGLGVTAGTLTRTTISYDTARNISVQINAPIAGAMVPATLPMRFSTTTLMETAFPACPATGTPVQACGTVPTSTADGLAKQLFPAQYSVKLGTCTEPVANQLSSTSVDLRPAASSGSTVIVPLGGVTVRVERTATPGVGIVGRTITFSHVIQSGSGCSTAENYTMSSVAAGSTILLPYGQWRVSTTSLSGTSPVYSVPDPVTLSSAARLSTITLKVTS
jgi:prepilin-type N-terminal cleavage/methylation domain-containing protein